jgi:hypothetical protein
MWSPASILRKGPVAFHRVTRRGWRGEGPGWLGIDHTYDLSRAVRAIFFAKKSAITWLACTRSNTLPSRASTSTGETARIEAAMMADRMLEKGDLDGQRVWIQIRQTIFELTETGQGPGQLTRFVLLVS